ncbi:MAG: recombinase family protein, partial [Pikeienuella sp.]
VRMIFDLYLRLGSIRSVQSELDRMGLRTRHRPGLKGAARGGARFGRGRLQHLLANPVYIGRIRHKEKTYEGAHEPIVTPAIWDAVQEKLMRRAAKARGRTAASAPSPLAGRIVDETGDRLTPSHASKKGRRYRYYVSHRLVAPKGEADASGWRLPAERLERAVAEAVADRLEDAGFAIGVVDGPTAAEIERIRNVSVENVATLRSAGRNGLLARIVAGGSISADALAIELNPGAIGDALRLPADRINPARLAIVAPWRIRRRGVETRFVIGGGREETMIDRNLAAKIALALRWLEEVKAGASIKAIAARENLTPDRIVLMLRLAWLDPGIVEAVASGRQPEQLTADAIFKSPHVALWREQRLWADGL